MRQAALRSADEARVASEGAAQRLTQELAALQAAAAEALAQGDWAPLAAALADTDGTLPDALTPGGPGPVRITAAAAAATAAAAAEARTAAGTPASALQRPAALLTPAAATALLTQGKGASEVYQLYIEMVSRDGVWCKGCAAVSLRFTADAPASCNAAKLWD